MPASLILSRRSKLPYRLVVQRKSFFGCFFSSEPATISPSAIRQTRSVSPSQPVNVVPSNSGTADATGARSIPRRYRSPATSPFAVEIRQGEKNVFTFDLAP